MMTSQGQGANGGAGVGRVGGVFRRVALLQPMSNHQIQSTPFSFKHSTVHMVDTTEPKTMLYDHIQSYLRSLPMSAVKKNSSS